MRIAVVAALPGELIKIVDTGWQRRPSQDKSVMKWIARSADEEWVAVCGGMGADAARRALVEAEADGRIDRLLSIGWAGALTDATTAGKTYIASIVVDAQTGERFDLTDGKRNLILISTARVAQEPEKRRLAATYGGVMVDMESATLVRLAQMRGIPVCCVKAISDEVGEDLPDFNLFINAQGQMRMGAFLLDVAMKPKYWKPLVRLGRNSAAAAVSLASAVLTILSGPKDFEEINRTGNVDWS